MRLRPQTFVFADPTEVGAAVDALVESGIRASRISIHRWGSGIAVRVSEAVECACLEKLVAMGGTASSEWSESQSVGRSVESIRTSTA